MSLNISDDSRNKENTAHKLINELEIQKLVAGIFCNLSLFLFIVKKKL